MKKSAELAIIVPCYNEEDVLPHSMSILEKLRSELIKEELISETSKLVFISDGSKCDCGGIVGQRGDSVLSGARGATVHN